MGDTNKRGKRKTLSEHLAEREAKRAATKGYAPVMDAAKIAELEALGTCDCPKCRAIRLSMGNRRPAPPTDARRP